MKRLLALALFLSTSSAWAQNPTCPTRPSSDNSNACASTAFVQNAVGGHVPLGHTHIFVGNGSNISTDFGTLATFSDTGTLGINPTTGFSLGYNLTQTLSGSTPTSQTGTFLGYAANRILVNNNSSYASSIFGLHVELDTTLAGSGPGNAAGFFHTISGAASGGSGFAIGSTHYISVETNWLGGTLGVPAGAAYGLSVYSRMGGTPIIHLANLTGMEINPEAGGHASSTVDYKSGIQIALLQNDSHQGISYDAALSISNIAGSTTLGWRDGILFSAANGQQPMEAANGTLIKTRGAGTVLNGIDISSYTVTTCSFKSFGICASGAGTLTLTPLTSSLTQGFNITQTGSGTASVSPPFILGNFAYNGIMISDAVNGNSGGVVGGLIVQTNTAGASASGFHGAGIFNANVNGVVPTDGTFGGVQGVSSLAQSLYPMGGTGTGVSTAKGAIYGFGILAIAYGPGGSWPGATNIFNITGGEINVKIATGASAYYKSGIQIASLSDDAVQGTTYDIGLSISAQSGSVGWKTGIGFNKANGGFPISSGGALIETADAFTVDRGIDLSAGVTYTTAALKSPGFLVNGSGSVAVGTFLTPDSPITINNNSAASVAPVASNSLHLIGGNSVNNSFTMDSYTGQNLLLARNAEGTLAIKIPTILNRSLLQILGQGWDGSAYANGANIVFTAGELWSGTAHGTLIKFSTTPLTTTTLAEAVRIQPSGALSVGALAIASDPGIGKINANGLVIQGSSSGAISIVGQAAAGTYNFNLPITVGSAGQVLTSQAGGATAMTWTTPTTGTVTSIATTSPITGGTITSTGTIACATCVTSAASLTSNSLMIGAGSQASAVTTTGTGVLTALGVNVGSAGAFVTFNGAGGTPTSLTLTNATGLPTTALTGTLQAAQEPAHTGDVTNSAGSLALTLATTQTAVHTWSLVNTYLENTRYSMTATGAGFWLASKVATVATADRFFFGSDASANDTFRIFSALSGGNSLQFASNATSTLGVWTFQGTMVVSGLVSGATTSSICYNTGTGALTYNGTVGTCTVSDESLKNIEGRIEGALDKLLRINGIRFTWRDNSYGSGEQIGVGAQTVEAVFPELVQTDSLGHKSADYQRLTAPIIEALRELKGDNDNLREEIKQLSRSR